MLHYLVTATRLLHYKRTIKIEILWKFEGQLKRHSGEKKFYRTKWSELKTLVPKGKCKHFNLLGEMVLTVLFRQTAVLKLARLMSVFWNLAVFSLPHIFPTKNVHNQFNSKNQITKHEKRLFFKNDLRVIFFHTIHFQGPLLDIYTSLNPHRYLQFFLFLYKRQQMNKQKLI